MLDEKIEIKIYYISHYDDILIFSMYLNFFSISNYKISANFKHEIIAHGTDGMLHNTDGILDGTVNILGGTVNILRGMINCILGDTDGILYGTVSILHGTVSILHGIFGILHSTFNSLHGTFASSNIQDFILINRSINTSSSVDKFISYTTYYNITNTIMIIILPISAPAFIFFYKKFCKKI